MTGGRAKTILLALGLALGVLAMIVALRGGVSVRESHAEHPKATVKVTRRYGPETVLSITPNAPVSREATGGELTPRASPLIQEYRATRQYGPLATRLDAKTPRTAEESWLLAELLERCGARALMQASQPPNLPPRPPPPTREETLKKFADGLSEKDPHREKRIAAFAAVNADRCEGVRAPRPNELRELRLAAAAEGEIKARVRLAREAIYTPAKPGSLLVQPDASGHLDVLRAAVESGEPYAVQLAASLLASPGGNLTMRIGPNEMPVVHNVFHRAAQVVSCELGAPCGPDSDPVLSACAHQGACDVRDLREYYFFYALSPHQSQLLTQYVDALRAVVRSRDWTQIKVGPGAPGLGWSVEP